MGKEVIINTNQVNSYGSRVVTAGIEIEQYKLNPILLYMHRRGWDGESLPIGKVDNLRIDGDKLIGTPVFDMEDEKAAKIARKWEKGFLNMCSAGLEPIELSSDTALIYPGQTRATVTKSKLIEVSIADIGANDGCVKLYSIDGKLLTLSTGEPSNLVPLLKSESSPEQQAGDNNNQTVKSMNKILITLGLAETASEDAAVKAIEALKATAEKAEKIELARIESAVEKAINDKRITAEKKDHFINLGKKSGFDSLSTTLELLAPARKPTDYIAHGAGSNGTPVTLTFAQMSEEQLEDMRENNQPEYVRLYKAEFGFNPELK